MLDRHGIAPSEAAFIGDDFPDIAVLRLVGLPVAVGNAVPEVKAACKLQLTRNGGRGAVREFAEMLLTARGEWAAGDGAVRRERSLPIAERARDARRAHRARPSRRSPRARGARRRSRNASASASPRAVELDRGIVGTRHRSRRRQVRAHRAQDRRDAHVDRHARGLPPPARERARRSRHRRRRTTSRSSSPSPANRTSCSGCSNICRDSGYARSPSPGRRTRRLRKLCDVALDAWVREEACPHDLAPTTSTTAALALGDALAVALLEHKGFRREDFARLHPGGALGRRLVTRVDEVMLTEPLPVLPPGSLAAAGGRACSPSSVASCSSPDWRAAIARRTHRGRPDQTDGT